MRYVVAVMLTTLSVALGSDSGAQSPGVRPDLSGVPPEFRFLFRQPDADDRIPTARKDPWLDIPYDSITLERSSCMIVCPSYTVTFYKGRYAEERGRETEHARHGRAELQAHVPKGADFDKNLRLFPNRSGNFVGWVDLWTYASISYLLQKAQFSMLPDRYVSGSSDERTSTLRITAAGRTKVVADEGEVGPIELWAIRQAIDSAAKSIEWRSK
jgi:hypothetical protein